METPTEQALPRSVRDKARSLIRDAWQDEEHTGEATTPFLSLAVRISSLLVLFTIIEFGLKKGLRLPEAAYTQAFILPQVAPHVNTLLRGYGFLLLALVLLFILGLIYKFPWLRKKGRLLGQPWSAFEHGHTLRLFILLAAFVLVWDFATYDYNLYFDRAHLFDRVLLLVFLALLFWRPVFVFPLVLVLIPVVWQFFIPIGRYSWAQHDLPFRILILFGVTFLLQVLTGRRSITDFLFVTCCLFAAHYWHSGLSKLQMNWLFHDHVYFLLPATYANGWLNFLEPETIAKMTGVLSWFNIPMLVFTLLIEAGALFCLWRRSLFRLFLVGWIAFHLGVFTVSGIFFWKWILLDAGLLLLFFRRSQHTLTPFFTRQHFILSVVLIAGTFLWFRPQRLAWYNARASYTYRYEAEGTSGARYTLPPQFFAPYDYQFTLSGFSYLVDEKRLPITWGSTGVVAVADSLAQTTNPEDVFTLEEEAGFRFFNPDRASTLDAFLQRFIHTLNQRQSKRTWVSVLKGPRQLWTFPHSTAFNGQEQIRKVRIYQVVSFYDEQQYLEIRNQLVREVVIKEASVPAQQR